MFCFILKQLNKIKSFPYYFLVVVPYAIGTGCEQALVLSLSKENKRQIVIFSYSCFKKLLKYKNHVTYLSCGVLFKKKTLNIFFKKIIQFFLNVEFFFFRSFLIFFNIKKIENFIELGHDELFLKNIKKFNISKSENDLYIFNKDQINKFDLASQDKLECKKILNSIKLDENQQYVCLHVRDSEFHEDQDRRTFRNSNIKNYYELIRTLVSKDYVVIRMGKAAKDRLEISDGKKIIDYAFSDFKNNKMDFFLGKYCKFHISGGGGFTQIPNLFNRPCLWTNDYRIYNELPLNPLSRKIFKKIIWKENKKEISLREYIDMPYPYHHVRYINQDIDFVENSAELLDNTIRSYIELFNNKKNFQLEKLQLKFNDFIFSRLKKMYFEVIENKKKIVNQQDIIIIFKQLSLLKFIEGSFELNFLKKNFFV